MQKNYTSLPKFLLAAFMCLFLGYRSLNAQPYPKEDYVLENGGTVLAKWKGTQEVVDLTKDPAFANVQKLKGSLFSGGTFAFNKTMKTLVLPASIKEVPSYSLNTCEALTTLDLSHCTKMTVFSVRYCDKLTSIDLSNCLTLNNLEVIDCKQISSLNLGNISTLRMVAFSKLNKFTTFDLSKNTSLFSLRITRCEGLTSLDLTPFTGINYVDVEGCIKLDKLDVSKNTQIKSLTASGLPLLTTLDVSMLADLTSIDVSNSTSLKSLDLSKCNEITEIGSSYSFPFAGCSGLQNVLLPNSITYVAKEAFKGCNKLSLLDFSKCEALKTVEKDAFAGVHTVKLPASVTTILPIGCKELYWLTSNPTAPGEVKGVKPSFEKLYVPAGSKAAFIEKGWEACAKEIIELKAVFYKVTVEKDGKGTISIAGAEDLNKVALGTKLTVTATPDEGYILASLTANGLDIKESKTFSVNENVVVKASFADASSMYDPKDYVLNEDGTILKKWLGSQTEVDMQKDPILRKVEIIQSTYSSGAFYQNTKLTKIVLPESLQKIDDYAFNKCKALTTVDCSHATKVEKIAFPSCEALTSLDLSMCTELKTLKLSFSSSISDLKIGSKKLIMLDLSWLQSLGSIDLSDQTELTKVNFSGCMKIESLDLSKATKLSILGGTYEKPFYYCKGLKSLKLPNSITTIFANAFDGCEKLSELDLSHCEKLTSVGENAFKGVSTVKLPASVPTFGPLGCSEMFWFNKTPEAPLEIKGKKPHFKKLYIPQGTLEAYTSKGWKECADELIEMKGDMVTITVNKTGNGTVTLNGEKELAQVKTGTEVTVEATPEEGWTLSELKANDVDILATKKFVANDNTTLLVTFTKNATTYKVETMVVGKGKITLAGADNLDAVKPGTTITVTATPEEGWQLSALNAGDEDILKTMQFVVNSDVTVSAVFTENQLVTITTKTEGEGTLTLKGVNDKNQVKKGATVTVEAVAAEGWQLSKLTAGGVDIMESKSFVANANTEVKAVFIKTTAVQQVNNGNDVVKAHRVAQQGCIELTVTEAARYALYTLNGEEVLNGEGQGTISLTVSANNFYILKVMLADGRTFTYKL